MTTPAALPTREQCIGDASAIFKHASGEAGWAYAEGGREAIAAQEYEPGHDRQAAADQYEALHARAMRQSAGATGSAA